ncbi:hypothetical protein [Kordia jejudonensis]|uniref:hypothetical protein n=1 Tax=Kordia jejudonensis TaxID=1348245 RepID=UPI000629CE51|nr:hypothetical protein [Kordia jejudonensis]
MKKRNLNSLTLNKKSISDLNINGGFRQADESGNSNKTHEAACSNYICDSRLGGCPSYYC